MSVSHILFFHFYETFFSPKKINTDSLCTHYKVYLYTIIQGYSSFHPSTPDVRCHLSLPAPPGRLRWWRGGWLGAGLRAALRSAQCCSGVPRVRCLRHTSLSSFYFTFYVFKIVQELFYWGSISKNVSIIFVFLICLRL